MRDCPAEPGAPTLVGELRRGVNPFNLGFGALATVGLVVLFTIALQTGPTQTLVEKFIGPQDPTSICLAALILFVTITAIHTLAHASMGWIFERGLRFHCQGQYQRARRWLYFADQPGMDHYDPNGVALAALKDCQSRLGVLQAQNR